MRTLLLSVALFLGLSPVSAQQSTTCVTPSVRCVSALAGPVGASCYCRTPQGWVRGRLA